MTNESFVHAVEGLRQRLTATTVSPPAPPPDGGATAEAFLDPWHELQIAVEELSVAQEELRSQNEELIRARFQLEAERQRYRDLFEFAPDAYLATDREGMIQEANRAAAALFNMPAARLARKPLLLYVAPEDRLRFQALLARLGGREPVEALELNLRPRDRSPLVVSVAAASVRAPQGGPVALRWLFRDVTAHKQEERLAVIGQMTAGLAHESRNALQRAQACLERLNWKLQDQPEARDLLDRVQHAQNDLVFLFESVREYAAPLRLDVRPCDLQEIWREAWAGLMCLHERRDARLDEQVGEVERVCPADPIWLRQVFRNIFENALAACADPVRVVLRCRDATLGDQPALCVAVADNGPGLNEEQRRRIFEPFFTTKSQGTGLGMAIARRIVEAHGGRIAVGEGPPGAEIVVALPRRNP